MLSVIYKDGTIYNFLLKYVSVASKDTPDPVFAFPLPLSDCLVDPAASCPPAKATAEGQLRSLHL